MLLITPSEVIGQAFTPRETINPSSIRELKIDIAQEYFIRPRLGQRLYEELLENRYPELIQGYIKPALAQFVRYGVIGELAICVSDHGALVYSSSTGSLSDEQNKEQDSTVQNEQSKQCNSTTEAETTKTNIDTTSEVKQVFDERTFSNETNPDTTNIDNHRIQTQSDVTVNTNGSGGSTEIATDQETIASTDKHKEVVLAQQKTTRNDEQLRAASPDELRVLAQRALSDGNILLAKAVRHIERNVDLYPSYVSSSFSARAFF